MVHVLNTFLVNVDFLNLKSNISITLICNEVVRVVL